MTETRGSQSSKSRYLGHVGTAMTAEVVGVCVLSGILDLVLKKEQLNTKNINQCIDAVTENY